MTTPSTARRKRTRGRIPIEHIVLTTVNGRYSFIFDALADFKYVHILPHLKVGATNRILVLPGNTLSQDQTVSTFAFGPSLTAGVSFLYHKYLSFGLDLREDFLFAESARQNLENASPSLSNQLIYDGGFQPNFSAMFFFGVHY